MSEFLKIIGWIVSGFLIAICLFFASRHLDFLFLRAFPHSFSAIAKAEYLTNFNSYRDFVTIITGMLTLVMATFGLVSYMSFKETREKSKELISEGEKIRSNFHADHKKLQSSLKIIHAITLKEKDRGNSLVIDILREAERIDETYPVTNILIGDEYYLLGGDNYRCAKNEYQKALDKNTSHESSPRALFGLALSEYRLSLAQAKQQKKELQDKEFFEQKDINEIVISTTQFISVDEEKTRNAISNMEKALDGKYAIDECYFELGRMYESIGSLEKSIFLYKKSFEINSNNLDYGFAYCVAWVRKNSSDVSKCNEDGIKNILKTICANDTFAAKLSYAILWYLSKKLGEEDNARDAFNETTKYALNEMFTISQ